MIRVGARLIGLAAALAAASASEAAAPSAAAPPNQASLDAAAFRLKVLFSALQSKEVDAPIKNVLFVCLYENAFEKISDETGKVLAANKLDPRDPNKVLTVMAGVCGLRPGSSPPPKAGPPPQKPSR
jgi:hypothetical protein